ncbi:NAD-dependent epimerase/dehydratase family protein [Clostridium vincentii]|uniref:GDP-6-deoxy-D-mannose reductase n=1 Tax=Clostridium vincentii TaxID=52704 RepID=A0A2T0BEE0_9CLOT|nr:SDR family NAD(P)-dependent oxidoreductase [Clostridium vincentii]PRR82271.1 GDP-6-deoxy-D-mannose reductase [Clostridium vincentii]
MEKISLMDKRILVTGGCGFIGSYLVKRLLTEGSKVAIICRAGTKPWRLEDQLENISIYEVDITDSIKVERCIKEICPEIVFHLAAYGVNSAQKEYIKAANINILGTINILNSLKDTGCKRFINIGSCAEYGDRKDIMKEDMDLQPVSIYGSSKACATISAHQIARENNIDIITLRPFGIFGGGEERHKVFCHIIMSILEDKEVRLTSCQQLRDYCYIENIIDGLILSAKSELKCNIFNIANGSLFPLKYYVDLIFKNMKTNKIPLYGTVESRKNEMWSPSADISKIHNELGWSPRIGLEDGIIKTIKWYEENKNKYLKYL